VADHHLLDPPAILAPTPLLVLAIPAPMTAVVPKTARGIAF
jgi:hypothetical protein